MSALPNSINYSEQIVSLPDSTKSYTLSSSPNNGSTFTPGSVIQLDMTRTGFLIPDSLYIRYRATVTSATTASELAATPVFTPFQRQEVMIGSTVVETINQFNQVANILTNLTTSVASKYGLQSSYGYDGNGSLSTLANLDGRRIVAAGETYTVSAPLPCVLSSCEKLIPLFAIPTVRLTWTMDTLSEMFAVIGGVTNFTISNFELVYTVVTMDQAVEQMIKNQGTFYIKSQSFFNTASVLASGTNGTITIPFNVNFASIKSLLVSFSGISSVNKSFDSFDPTSSNGDLSVSVGGLTFPQRPISTFLNKSAVLQELRKCVGSIFGSSNALAINSLEFGRQGADVTTSVEPGKAYFGFNLEKMAHPNMLTGVSSAGSAILLNLNTNTGTAQNYNVNLIVCHDVLLEIDSANMLVNAKR